MSAGRGRGAPGLNHFLLLALVFLLPLAIAFWLYFGGSSLVPEDRTNHGVILEPIVNLEEALPGSPIASLSEDEWLLIFVHAGPCAAECRETLVRLRQSRLMLGQEMDRVRRVFLHGPAAPDRVLLEREHPGLTALEDAEAAALITGKRPQELTPGGLYLVDPLGNLVMYFSPDIAPGEMVDDIKHLLKLSQIG